VYAHPAGSEARCSRFLTFHPGVQGHFLGVESDPTPLGFNLFDVHDCQSGRFSVVKCDSGSWPALRPEDEGEAMLGVTLEGFRVTGRINSFT
jgi:hypothetical protein